MCRTKQYLGLKLHNEWVMNSSKGTFKGPQTLRKVTQDRNEEDLLLQVRKTQYRRVLLPESLNTGIKQQKIHIKKITCTEEKDWEYIPLLHFSKTFLCSRTSEFKISFSCFTLFT